MSRSASAVCVALLVLLPRAAAACSPALRPDQVAERAAFYAAIRRPPYFLWGLSVVAAVAWLVIWRRRGIPARWPAWLFALLAALAVFQPAWWMESMRGDCGWNRDLAALGVGMLSLVLLALGRRQLRAGSASQEPPMQTTDA